MRLIDTDALIEQMDAEPEGGYYSPHDVISLLMTQPVAEERKKGKWIIGNVPPSVGTHCDECGWAWSDHIDAVKLNKTLSLIKTNFCPNCGADMRKEIDDEDNGQI